MNIIQLRYFLAVVETGSFVSAAARLRIAQPAVSRQVMLLEAEFGERLLERTSRGSEVTAAGAIVRERAAIILQHIDELGRQFQLPGEQRRYRLRLGVPPSFTSVVNAAFVDTVAQHLPQTDVHVQELWTGQIGAMITNLSLDLGIVCQSQFTSGHWRLPLNRELLFLIEAAGGETGPVSLAAIAERPLVLPTRIHGMRTVVEQHFAAHGIVLNVAHEADNWGMVLSLVEAGRAATILPRREVRESLERRRVVARRIDTAPSNRFYLVASRALAEQSDLLRRGEGVHARLAEMLHDDI